MTDPSAKPDPAAPGAGPPAQGPPSLPKRPVPFQGALVQRPRPVRRRRPGPLLIVLGVLVGTMSGLGILAWVLFVDVPQRTHSAAGAELFVRRICLADAGEPGEEGDPAALCGYAKAYDMLSEKLRSEMSYPAFCEDFELVRERHGSVQRIELDRQARDKRQRLVSYRYALYMGSPDSEIDALRPFSLDLTLKWLDDRWVVMDYRIRPATQAEIR